MIKPDIKLIVSYLVAVALSIITIIIFANGCGKQAEIDSVEKIEAIKITPVQHHIDAQGLDHGTKQIAAADAKTINDLYDHLLDSVLKHVKTSQKNLQSVVAISTQTSDTIKPAITFVHVDTCMHDVADSLNYSDQWINIKASIATDSLIYHINDSLIYTAYYKHVKFLKDELFLDAYSLNKNTTIKGMTAVDLQQAKPHKLGLDVTAGCFWNGNKFSPGIGAGISYRITR